MDESFTGDAIDDWRRLLKDDVSLFVVPQGSHVSASVGNRTIHGRKIEMLLHGVAQRVAGPDQATGVIERGVEKSSPGVIIDFPEKMRGLFWYT